MALPNPAYLNWAEQKALNSFLVQEGTDSALISTSKTPWAGPEEAGSSEESLQREVGWHKRHCFSLVLGESRTNLELAAEKVYRSLLASFLVIVAFLQMGKWAPYAKKGQSVQRKKDGR